MTNPISGIGSIGPTIVPQSIAPAAGSTPAAGPSFQNLLMQSLEQTAGMEHGAQDAIARSLAGEDITQVEVFSAVKQADLALRMMVQVRNKVLDAYNEVKNLRM